MDKVLKQRLVGAAILIALAVIFVPMLFDGPDESRGLRDSSIDLPAPPADRQEVRRLPLDPGRVNDQRLEEPAELIQEPAPGVSEPEAPVGAEPSVAVTDPAVVEAPPEQPGESGAEEVSERNPEPEIEPEPVRADPEPTSEPPTSTDNSTPPTGAWQVQVASFSSAETAE